MQALQTHLHVAAFDNGCYSIIKDELRKDSMKSSTFNVLRKLPMAEKKLTLERFRDSGFDKTVLKKMAKAVKTPKEV